MNFERFSTKSDSNSNLKYVLNIDRPRGATGLEGTGLGGL
jgi:hypothetical protein